MLPWRLINLRIPKKKLKKVPLCSPAEIEGSKMSPRMPEIATFKNRDKYAQTRICDDLIKI